MRPRLPAEAWFRSRDEEPDVPDPSSRSFTASDEGCLRSPRSLDVWKGRQTLRVAASRGAHPASGRSSGLASSLHVLRWSAARARVPRGMDLRTTIDTRTLRGPRCIRLTGHRRGEIRVRTGCAALDGATHPLALPMSAGEQVDGAAQRRRPTAHAAEPFTPPGAETSAERRPWWSRSRGPGPPHLAFLEEIPTLSRETARRVGFSCRPPDGRSPEATLPVALRFCHSRSPASTSCPSPLSRQTPVALG